jgi:hypothetical protein
MEQIRQEEWIPAEWKRERVTLLHKGKSRLSLDNYRGIAIGSNMCKIFTRIIRTRIQKVVEERGLLGEMQNGFRKGRSTNDNLFVLSQIMERAQRGGRQAGDLLLVFIDLRKAYDRVWRTGVWKVLRTMGLGQKLISLLTSLYEGHKRRVQTLAGFTEWVMCTIGVKQGCVLSPILFALFIAELESRIKNLEVGVGIGGKKLGGLLFADDLVLMAESIQDLEKLVTTTDQFMKERRLEINVAKSGSMRVGRRRAQGIRVKLVREGKVEVIEEVNVYKYLGVRVGNNRLFGYQMDDATRDIKWKIASLKAKAGDLSDTVAGTDILWKRAMRPALLYGAEIIIYTKAWVRKLEIAQNTVARWLTGTSSRARRAGLRGEMGWRITESEIWERQLIYYGVIKGMGENRWPNILLNHMEGNQTKSRWVEAVRRGMQEVGVEYTGQGIKQWRQTVKTAVREWNRQAWLIEKERNDKLDEYPKEELGEREEYLNFSKSSKILCKFRIGDVDTFNEGRCQACRVETNDIRTHILTECESIAEIRGEEDWGGTELQPGEPGWLKEVLRGEQNKKRIQKIGLGWKERVDRAGQRGN